MPNRAQFYLDNFFLHDIYPKQIEHDMRRLILEEAEQIIHHKVKLFGGRMFQCGKKIDWDRDPATGGRWRLLKKKPFLLAIAANKDIKWVWEINKQQHLLVLAKAFLLTYERKFAVEI